MASPVFANRARGLARRGCSRIRYAQPHPIEFARIAGRAECVAISRTSAARARRAVPVLHARHARTGNINRLCVLLIKTRTVQHVQHVQSGSMRPALAKPIRTGYVFLARFVHQATTLLFHVKGRRIGSADPARRATLPINTKSALAPRRPIARAHRSRCALQGHSMFPRLPQRPPQQKPPQLQRQARPPPPPPPPRRGQLRLHFRELPVLHFSQQLWDLHWQVQSA
mmetsp:Transcript_88452/g.235228  ORF Transcript_88452/g.235228 Transcript_88452/m.235228 type:complete len:227 (+) Transcript_88452:727-1407(+)